MGITVLVEYHATTKVVKPNRVPDRKKQKKHSKSSKNRRQSMEKYRENSAMTKNLMNQNACGSMGILQNENK